MDGDERGRCLRLQAPLAPSPTLDCPTLDFRVARIQTCLLTSSRGEGRPDRAGLLIRRVNLAENTKQDRASLFAVLALIADSLSLLLFAGDLPIAANLLGAILASVVAVVLWSLVRRSYNLRQAKTGHIVPKRTTRALVLAIILSIVLGSFHILAIVRGVGL